MPYYTRDSKRDHNFDNHPYVFRLIGFSYAYMQFRNTVQPFQGGVSTRRRSTQRHQGRCWVLTAVQSLESCSTCKSATEVSQYMQNFFNFNSLLFSFFVSQTYASLYQQQDSTVNLDCQNMLYHGQWRGPGSMLQPLFAKPMHESVLHD